MDREVPCALVPLLLYEDRDCGFFMSTGMGLRGHVERGMALYLIDMQRTEILSDGGCPMSARREK